MSGSVSVDDWKNRVHLVEVMEDNTDPPTTIEIYRGSASGCLAAVKEWLREPFGSGVVVKRVA